MQTIKLAIVWFLWPLEWSEFMQQLKIQPFSSFECAVMGLLKHG